MVTYELKILRQLQRAFPLWALQQQIQSLRRFFASKIRKATVLKDLKAVQDLQQEEAFEVSMFIEELQEIRSRNLWWQAQKQVIHMPDLKWETGQFGYRFLDDSSISRLYYAVKEQRDKSRDYYLKLAATLIGIIGALTGLVAVWKRK